MHIYFYFQSLWTRLLKKVTVSLSYEYHSVELVEVTYTHTQKTIIFMYVLSDLKKMDFICEVFLLFFKSLKKTQTI